MSLLVKYALSLLSALLLSLPWYESFSGVLLWVAFVPLLLVERNSRKMSSKLGFIALTLLLWNTMTTWWIWNATIFGMFFAIIGNSLQMWLVFWIALILKQRIGERKGYIFLMLLWIAWEWFYFDAEITWPWLVLGNGFAKDVVFIQWYEYLGVLGGTLWIWIVNLTVLRISILWAYRKKLSSKLKRCVVFLCVVILVPTVYSLVTYYSYQEDDSRSCSVLILQPNVDPFNSKFDETKSVDAHIESLLNLIDTTKLRYVDYIITPETAMPGYVDADKITTDYKVTSIRNYIKQYPHTTMIVGVMGSKYYGIQDKKTPTARNLTNNTAYDLFNSVIWIDSSQNVPIYHKSKLVVGVEMLPYIEYFPFLNNFAIKLGGSSGSLGTQKERITVRKDSVCTGVAICYESVFGEFFTEYIKKGANMMVIITNDGWWKDTPGYKQHLRYASLRAIETRRSIARSANTGISAVIDQRGTIVEQLQWWTRDTIFAQLNLNNKQTFYVQYGDIVGRSSAAVIGIFLLFLFGQHLRKKYGAATTIK